MSRTNMGARLAPRSDAAHPPNHDSQSPALASESLPSNSSSPGASYSSSATSSLLPSWNELVASRFPISPRWWEGPARNLLCTSSRLDYIILVCEHDLFLNPCTPIEALCKLPSSRLDDLCIALEEYGLQSRDEYTKAEHIVGNLRKSSSAVPGWDGSWLIPAMLSPMDVNCVAEKLDYSICSVFCEIHYCAWVKQFLGYKHDGISSFLDAVLSLRNNIGSFLQSDRSAKWVSLEVALCDRHPLAHWLISTALSGSPSTPYDALQVFSDPILKEFSRRNTDFVLILQRLSILAFRYDQKIVRAIEVDWHEPFPTCLSLFEDLRCSSLQTLAISINEDTAALFAAYPHRTDIDRHWSTLANEVAECAFADDDLVPRLLRLAEFFQRLRNYHGVAAVWDGLRTVLSIPIKSRRLQPVIESSPMWAHINPENNYTGCKALMAKYPGLPFLQARALQLSDLDQAQFREACQFIQFFGRKRNKNSVGQTEL